MQAGSQGLRTRTVALGGFAFLGICAGSSHRDLLRLLLVSCLDKGVKDSSNWERHRLGASGSKSNQVCEGAIALAFQLGDVQSPTFRREPPHYIAAESFNSVKAKEVICATFTTASKDLAGRAHLEPWI